MDFGLVGQAFKSKEHMHLALIGSAWFVEEILSLPSALQIDDLVQPHFSGDFFMLFE